MSFNKSIACSMLVIFMLFTTCIAKGDTVSSAVDGVQEQLDNLQSSLSALNSQAKSLEPTKKAKGSSAREQYKKAVAQADSEYRRAKKELDKKYKDAGINMLSALTPSKKQASVLKSLNDESKEITDAYTKTKAQAKEAYEFAIKKLDKETKLQKKQIAYERAKLLKETKIKESELKKELKTAKDKAGKDKRLAIEQKKAQAMANAKAKANEIESVKAELRQVDKQFKQKTEQIASKAKSQSMAMAKRKAEIEREYKADLVSIEKLYKDRLKAIERQKKAAGVDGLGGLFLNKKKKAAITAIKQDRAEIIARYKAAKIEAKKKNDTALADMQKQADADKKALTADKKLAKTARQSGKLELEQELSDLKGQAKKPRTDQRKDKIARDQEKKQVALAKKKAAAKLKADKKKADAEKEKATIDRRRVVVDKKAAIFKAYEEKKSQAKEDVQSGINGIESVNAELRQVDKQYKQKAKQIASKAKSQSMAMAKRKAEIEREYRADLVSSEDLYKNELKELGKKKKATGVDGLGSLFPDKKKKAAINAIKQDRAEIVARYSTAKSEAKKKKDKALTDMQNQADADKRALTADKKLAKTIRQSREAELKQKLIGLRRQAKRPKTDQPKDKALSDEEKKQLAQAKKNAEAEYKEAKKQAKTQKAEVKKNLSIQLKALDKGEDADLASISRQKQQAKKQFKNTQIAYKAELKKALTKSDKSEAKRQLSIAQADYKAVILELDSKKKELSVDKSGEKKRLEAETMKKMLHIDNQVEYAKALSQLPGHIPAKDETPTLKITELQISGNSLIATDKLLANLPLVYPAAEKDAETEETIDVFYDFRVLHEIISDPGVDRQVSQKTIQTLTKYLLSVYEAKKYAGIFVYVPKEAVNEDGSGLKNDILSIKVLEGKVSDISVNMYDLDQNEVETGYLKKSSILSWSPAKIGKVVNKKQIDDFTRLLNQNPDRFTQMIVSKGTEPDSLSLSYDVYEANPWHWYFQIDNSGVDEKHKWSPRVGVTNTNLTGNDDSFSFAYQAKPYSTDFMKQNYSAYGSYEMPLFNPALRVGFFAGYSKFDLAPGSGTGIAFRGNGSFYGNSLRYNFYQIDGGPLKDWMFDFVGTISHEKSQVTPSLFKDFLEQEVIMNLLGVGVEAHHSDYAGMSKSYLSFTKTQSIGGGSNDEEFQLARTETNPEFSIYTFSASHRQYLDEAKVHELAGTFRYITSDTRLAPAKMTTFGGMYSVRGYEENEIVADGGVLASLQYRFDLSKSLINQVTSDAKERDLLYKKTEMWPPNLSLLAFSDYGRAETKDPVAGEVANETLMSVGVGVQAELGVNYSAGIYYAMPLEDAVSTQSGDAGSWYFNFVYRW